MSSAQDQAGIHPLVEEDFQQAAEFLYHFRNGKKPSEYWLQRFAFWWHDNPAYSGEMVKGWVVKKNHQIKGFYAVIPLPFQVDGHKEITYTGSSLFIDPECQGWGAGLLMNFLKLAANTIFWHATPGPESEQLLTALRMPTIPYVSENMEIVLSGHGEWLVCQLEERYHLSLWHYVKRAVGWMDRLRLPESEVRVIHHFDADFDRFWEEVRPCYPTTRWRDAQFLNWFCFGWPERQKTVLADYTGNQLRGYAIFQPGKRGAGRYLECLDLCCAPRFPNTPQTLMQAALRQANLHWMRGIVVPSLPELTTWLNHYRPKPERVVYKTHYFRYPKAWQSAMAVDQCRFLYGEGDTAI